MLGTGLNLFSLIVYFYIEPLAFIYLQSLSWSLIVLSLVIAILTKRQYRILRLNSRFPLKLDHLIISICVLVLSIAMLSFVDILNFAYRGEVTFFALGWTTSVFFSAFILYIKIKTQQKKKGNI